MGFSKTPSNGASYADVVDQYSRELAEKYPELREVLNAGEKKKRKRGKSGVNIPSSEMDKALMEMKSVKSYTTSGWLEFNSWDIVLMKESEKKFLKIILEQPRNPEDGCYLIRSDVMQKEYGLSAKQLANNVAKHKKGGSISIFKVINKSGIRLVKVNPFIAKELA